MDRKNRLQELDALRGLAAFGVLLFHFTLNQNGKKLGWQFGYGVTGVDIFFMISGFVIFLTIHKIKKWQEFVVFRFARLYPTYWACMLLTTIFILIYNPDTFDPLQFLANLTMISTLLNKEVLDGSYWTLLVELQFYLWILILYIPKGIKYTAQIGFFFTISIVLFHYFEIYYHDFYWITLKRVPLLSHFPLFFSGILFYNLKFKTFSLNDVVLILVCLAASLYLHDKGGRAMYATTALEHQSILVFYHIVFALFVLDKLHFIVKPSLLFLGKISYSLYLLHQYIGVQLISTFTETLHLNIYFALILTIIICIGLAYLVTTYLELPAIRYFRSRYKNREQSRFEKHTPEALKP